MDVEAAKAFGAAIAVLPLGFVGIALGNLFSNWIASVARNPAAAPNFQIIGFIGLALTEALGLFSLVIAILILFVL